MSNNEMWIVAEYIAALAEESAHTANTAQNDWSYACEQPDIKQFGNERYFFLTYNDLFPAIIADSKSIKIDKKNKVIQVWSVWLLSPNEKKRNMQKYGSKYSEYGYVKRLDTINYGSMMSDVKAFSEYECNGNVISSNTFNNPEWQPIIPDSVMEGILEKIKEKYKLQ